MAETKKNNRSWVWIVVIVGVVVALALACCAGGLAGFVVYKWAEKDAADTGMWHVMPDVPSIQDLPQFEWPEEAPAVPTPFSRLQSGAVLTEVIEDSPADDAGLLVGDVILSVEGREITNDYTLYEAITRLEPGDTINVEIWSRGDTDTLRIRLRENPEEDGTAWLGVRFMMMDIPERMRRSDSDD